MSEGYKNQKTAKVAIFSGIIVVLAVFVLSFPAEAATGINKQISFQGKVVNSNGTNVTNGNYDFVFKLYSVSSGGSAIWTETWNSGTSQVTVTDGVFQVNLGTHTALPGSIDFNTDNIYLGVTFHTDSEMTPRIRFTAVPYAFNADKVHGLTVTDTTGTLTIANGKTISFADAFSTSGAFPVTMTATASTSVTLPTSGTLATIAGSETFTNKTIGSTGLVFSGAATDITTASGESLVITAAGSGTIDIQDATTVDSLTTDTGGVSIASGQSYTGSGAVTLSSGTGTGLTIDSGTTGAISIGTGANAKTITIGNSQSATGIVLDKGASGQITLSDFASCTALETNASGHLVCGTDDTGGGATLVVRESDASPSVATVSTLEFGPATTSTDEFIVLDQTGGVARVQIGNQVGMLNQAETVTGGWTFGTASTTFTTAIDVNTTSTIAGLTVDGGALTLSGLATDITTGANESLVVVANGSGIVDIQDSLTADSLTIDTGGITISSGALAVNSDSITSDGALVINATSTDIQDAVTVDSLTTDTGGVSIASGQSYTGSGAVTLSSASASGLTINSGTTGTIAIGDDASAETINIGTGAAAKALTLGSTNTTSSTVVQSGSGDIALRPNNGSTGNVQIGTGGSGSTTPDLLALDVKSDAGDPSGANGKMYYNANTNKFRCFQASAWTDCIGSGSGGTPAGSNTQIQYNNSGAFGADAGLTFNATTQQLGLSGTDAGIIMNGITNEPSAPASGTLEFYSKSIAGRMMPKWVGPSGLDSIVQPMVAMNKVAWWNPPGNATTAPGVLGMAAQTIVSNGGTALTARNVATTNLFTRMKRAGIVTTATAGYIASMRNGTAQFTVGNGSGLGGFTYVTRFGSTDAIAAARAFAGFTSSTAVPTNVEPSTLTNAVGMCQLSTSNNWQICYGGSAAQTPIDLGVNFPANTASTDMYELILFSPANANNVVNYRVTRLNTGNVASGTLTAATPGTQLPASTTLLATRFWKTNNASASVVGLDIASMYIETDY